MLGKWIVGVKELKKHHDYNVNKDTIKTLSDLLCVFSYSEYNKWVLWYRALGPTVVSSRFRL